MVSAPTNVPAFYGDDGGFPFVAMNTTSSPITFNGGSAKAPSHKLIVHPSPISPAIVEWTSPIDGTLN